MAGHFAHSRPIKWVVSCRSTWTGVVNTVAATLESVISSRGQIVLVSSVFAYLNGAGAIPYAMSKAAVEQLGRGLGVELAPSRSVGNDGVLLTHRDRHDPSGH